MTQVATVTYADQATGDDAAILVRVIDGQVGLTVTLRSDGDVETFIPPAALDELIAGLRRARGD